MKKIIQQVLIYLISFNLVFGTSLNAAVGINAQQRTQDIVTDMINGGVPSDLPVAAVSNFFDKEHIDLIKNFDLSQYVGKKVFVGYGIYDTKESQCKYIEKPGLTKQDYKNSFTLTDVFNQHAYGVSATRMTYTQCKALATKLGGYPVAIDTSTENFYITDNFIGKKTGDNATIDKVWVGATRKDCAHTNYISSMNTIQHYTNWSNDSVELSCDSSKLNIQLDATGKWSKVNNSVPAYCLVEFNTPDMYKPLKVCAPWWKVRRDYPNDVEGLYNTKELEKINQADIPIKLNVCTKYKKDAVDKNQTNKLPRNVYCTSYYSRTVLPECVRNMYQPQCKVDECNGYIKNACMLKSSETVGKGYVKGEVMINGVKQEVKVKDKIVTHQYACPPSPPSPNECLENSTVIVYPKECPGSDCQATKECILAINSSHSSEDYNTAYNKCFTDHKCEKIYPNPAIPPVLDSDGSIKYLKGKCSDGTYLNFPVNIQAKEGKKCIEYEKITKTKHVVQHCVLERPYEDHTVNMALTDKDVYQDNPNCIRLDKVKDSIAPKSISISYQLKGYFKHRTLQANLDNQNNELYDGGKDLYVLYSAMPNSLGAPTSVGQENNITEHDISNTLNCSKYEDSNTTSNIWVDRNRAVFDKNSSDMDYSSIDFTQDSSYGVIVLDDGVASSSSECDNYASNHGFGAYLDHTSFYVNPIDSKKSTCKLYMKKYNPDPEFDSIDYINVDTIKYTFHGTMTKKECRNKAICLDGRYNESDFPNDSSTAQCIVVSDGTGAPHDYIDQLKEENGYTKNTTNDKPTTKSQCTPTSYNASISDVQLDGVKNIIVFEDYLRGGFGYYSNYNAWPPRSNVINITYGGETYKLPLGRINTITDYLKYNGIYHHESWRAKSPDIPLTLASGAISGLAAYGATEAGLIALSATGIGAVVAVVMVVVFLLFGKSKKMDRQYTEYHIFKDIPYKLYDMSQEYDARLHGSKAAVSGEQSSHNDPDSNYRRMTYWHVKTDTGRYEPGDFLPVLKKFLVQKQSLLTCGGIERSEIDRLTHPDERSINYGYPKCKWYRPWCEKVDNHYNQIITPQSSEELVDSPEMKCLSDYGCTKKEKMAKETTTVYLGADDSIVVLVPYLGDYELKAYDKYHNLLSTFVVHKSNFTNEDPKQLKYAQVNFGLNMSLAPGLTPGANTNACTHDRMVEWGGGVSGVFFESQRTDMSTYCQKSNNDYVKDRSMTELFVRPLNMDRGYTIKLKYPMPFPNRVWIATLGQKDIRHYRCYKDFPDCKDNQYKEVQQ